MEKLALKTCDGMAEWVMDGQNEVGRLIKSVMLAATLTESKIGLKACDWNGVADAGWRNEVRWWNEVADGGMRWGG